MSEISGCPKCASAYAYLDGELLICPECAHEWHPEEVAVQTDIAITDANGNMLADGDTVSVIKDLKVKGSSAVVKLGTKVKSIRLLTGAHEIGGHDIDCKIAGVGAMQLKSAFVKKA